MFLLFILISGCFGVASSSYCPQDEYKAGMECCPSCPSGMHVVKDCTERIITKCSMCPEGTFQAGFNELKQCSNCTKCDAGLGLKVNKSCSSTSDAVCEVLDGFVCSDSNGGGCRAAQKDKACSPGQYIGQRGRKKRGTDSTDSECREHGSETRHVARIIPVILVMALMASIIIAIFHWKKKIELAHQRDVEETSKQVKERYEMINQHLEKKETTEQKRKEHEEVKKLVEPSPLRSTDGPEPTRDQQECTITMERWNYG